jgi:exodeoxyribonuclease VII large subunit
MIENPMGLVRTNQMRLDEIVTRLQSNLRLNLAEHRIRHTRLLESLKSYHPKRVLHNQMQHLGHLNFRLKKAMEAILEAEREHLKGALHRIRDLSPDSILRRGYAIARRLPDGRLIRSADLAPKGTDMEILLQFGRLIARVTKSVPKGLFDE